MGVWLIVQLQGKRFLWAAPDAWCEGKHMRLCEILCNLSHTHIHTRLHMHADAYLRFEAFSKLVQHCHTKV